MQRKYFPAVIMLTAGIVTCIISIVRNMDVLSSLIILLGVLIGFYLIGLFGNWIITKVMESGTVPTEEEGKEEGTEEENPEDVQLEGSDEVQSENSEEEENANG